LYQYKINTTVLAPAPKNLTTGLLSKFSVMFRVDGPRGFLPETVQLRCGLVFEAGIPVIYFSFKKEKTCTTISHVPQKAKSTEAGQGRCLSEACSVLL
jgi:hypothetical protein